MALFLFDAVLDCAMIAMALRLGGRRIRPGRLLAGALMGACIAGWARAAELGRMCAALLWLPGAVLMMATASGGQGRLRPVRDALLLLCAAGLLGGTVHALLGATGSLPAAYALGAAALIAMTACAARAGRSAGDAQRARVVIGYGGTEAAFDAIIDSGNTLRDYLTHLPVIVLPRETALARLALEDAALRPIFADTAGGRKMMDCFMPQTVTLETGKKKLTVHAAAALARDMGRDMPALAPAVLMRAEERGGI